MSKQTQTDPEKITQQFKELKIGNIRVCPECGFETIAGMPGGRDATCRNCGYKDPCCYD